MATELKTASVLAFERKLDPSDALMYAGNWDDRSNGKSWPGIEVETKSVRGTISNRLKTKDQDPAKLDASIQNPNLQTVDVAALPLDSDTLRVRFTLRVIGGVGKPSACNSSEYEAKLAQLTTGYREEKGFHELACRYATNLANARFLWRNRVGTEQIEVQVSEIGGESNWMFDAHSVSLRNFDAVNEQEELTQLSALIEQGLSGEKTVLLDIVAYAKIGDGQEVYPSQELILDRGSKTGQKSKTLYSVGGIAGIHSQKLGNAIRTIDTWYPDSQGLGPIAIEPYGSVTSQGKAYRQPKAKVDFYTLLDRWVLKDETPSDGDLHYVMAVLVRGGVFGESEKG